MILAKKINESFCYFDMSTLTMEQRREIADMFTLPIKGARFDPLVERGLKPSHEYFFRVNGNNMIIPIGLINFVRKYGVYLQINAEYTREEILSYIDTLGLPFKLYDHQLNAILDSLLLKKQMVISCTGSGKSAVISIISGFLISKQKKGLILVPSINLVSQIHNDMLDYGLNELYDNTHLIGGEYTEKHFDKPLTVSTWQSVRLFKEHLDEIDFILVDEAQGLKGSESLDISQKCVNAEYKFGLSGTMPEEPIDRMSIMSAVGTPTIYIRTQGLIELGLATPVNINAIKLKYDSNVIHEYSKLATHHQRLKYIKEYENRNLFISSLARQVTENSGNTLVLFEHVEHGKNIFKNICKSRIGIDPENKLITGKKAFEFQKEHRLYFINGEVKGGVREQIRNILETDTDAILVANYSTMSTGVNIKNLHNIVFARPMKSFVTITQSIGRGIRTHVSKDVVNIYDLVDDFKNFIKQYNYRKEWSYETEGFPLIESHIWI